MTQPPAPSDHARATASAGLFGKLPARGDFVVRNLPPDLLRPFEDWLISVMREARELLAGDWLAVWQNAPAWRFWIGGAALDGDWRHGFHSRGAAVRSAAVTGVLLPSADRSGRHFPLVILLADRHAHLMPPPVLGHADRGWYAACERLLRYARAGADLAEVEAALAALPAPQLPEGWERVGDLLERRALWAVGSGDAGRQGAVWADIGAVDHHLAATHRSYWWREPLPDDAPADDPADTVPKTDAAADETHADDPAPADTEGGGDGKATDTGQGLEEPAAEEPAASDGANEGGNHGARDGRNLVAALSLPGLPDAESFAFMLAGALPAAETQPVQEAEPETADPIPTENLR